MATRFEDAPLDLVATAEGFAGFAEVTRACVVRDLRGRVRLVVDAPAPLDGQGLAQALGARLGAWFQGPIVSTGATAAAEGRLAKEILARAQAWPAGWGAEWADVTGAPHPVPGRWQAYQRVLSKQAWLDAGSRGGGAWPLTAGAPVVAAFYSFKGGVGRSTVLGILAWQLARAGKKVVCVDLDVEAPGLGSLFDVRGEGSVMEHLLTHAATGRAPGGDLVQAATVHGRTIQVVPAGSLGRAYLEKLARLDYLGATSAQDSPVAQALRVLLERLRGQHAPDYILLDCRAGIHDLGGLSINDFAHVDVLVGRDTPQGRDGLALTLEVLEAHRAPQAQRILLVQTFVPLPLNGVAGQASRDRFRQAMYAACQNTLYRTLEDHPAEDDTGVAHYPWPVGQLDELAACQSLADVSDSTLANDAFNDIRARLEALAAPEGPEAEEDDRGIEHQ